MSGMMPGGHVKALSLKMTLSLKMFELFQFWVIVSVFVCLFVCGGSTISVR